MDVRATVKLVNGCTCAHPRETHTSDERQQGGDGGHCFNFESPSGKRARLMSRTFALFASQITRAELCPKFRSLARARYRLRGRFISLPGLEFELSARARSRNTDAYIEKEDVHRIADSVVRYLNDVVM